MSRYYIDAELTSMIGACQEDVYEYEVYFQSFKLARMHLCSPRIMKYFFADKASFRDHYYYMLRTCDWYIYIIYNSQFAWYNLYFININMSNMYTEMLCKIIFSKHIFIYCIILYIVYTVLNAHKKNLKASLYKTVS